MVKDQKYVFVVFLMALVSFSCLSFSASYAFFTEGKTVGSLNQSISTGNIDSTVTYVTSHDMIMEPLPDEEGLLNDISSKIKLQKTTNYSIFYNILISFPSDESINSLIPAEFIKIALYDVTNGENLLVGPVRMADLPIFRTDSNNVINTEYNLIFSTIDNSSAVREYGLKAWIDENTPETYNNKEVSLSLGIYQETKTSRQYYDISGKVYNGANPVSEATVSLQYGSISAQTSSDGSFTLQNVPVGTYNLNVNSNGNNQIMVNINSNLNSSGTNKCVATTPSSGQAGKYIQEYANTFYTTPYKIITANNLTTDSNQVTTSSFTVPTSYVINGLKSLDKINISNIKIDISNNSISSIS